MKKTVLILAAIFSMLSYVAAGINIASERGIKGNGKFVEKERGVMEFTAVETRGSVDVIIADVANAPVKVSGDENLVDLIETYVKDDVLYVQLKNKQGYSSRLGLKVTIPNTGRINKITASGSSDVKVDGCLVSDNLLISCSGSSDFKGNIKATKCELNGKGSSDFKGSVEAESCIIKCSGSSDCIINGKANICEITVSGSSDFKGYDFIVNKLDCSASGSSDIKITCNEEISVRAGGSSDVYYRGNAKVISQHITGSSDLHNR
jgi:hypothetical protein